MMTGCTTVHKSMREPNAKVEFKKSDFRLSEQVSAKATSTTAFTIDWNRLFKKETGAVEGVSFGIDLSMIPVVGGVVADKTSSYALYELMKANPGYGVACYPQFETKTENPYLGSASL